MRASLARSFTSACSDRLQLPSRSRCEGSSRATWSISVSRLSHQPLQPIALGCHQPLVGLRAAAAYGFGLHSLLVAEWDGASSLKVLAVQGRTLQLSWWRV